jgi:glutamyl-tRNA reductase
MPHLAKFLAQHLTPFVTRRAARVVHEVPGLPVARLLMVDRLQGAHRKNLKTVQTSAIEHEPILREELHSTPFRLSRD